MKQVVTPQQNPPAIAPDAFEAMEQASPAPSKSHKTLGTRAHWAMTYLGGDWFLNSTFGVSFAYFASRTHIGQTYYYKPATNFFRSLAKPFIKNPETLEKAVGGGTSFLNIMFGGTVINPLLTYMEEHDKKKAISKSIDTMVYGKEKVENDPQFQAAYDEIDREPKRDTKSVWLARGLALAPLIVASSVPSINNFFKTTKIPGLSLISHDTLSNFSMKLTEKLNIRPKGMMSKTGVSSITKEVNTNWQAMHEYIGFDFGYTVYYALLHSAAVSAVARLFQTRRDHREERREAKLQGHTLPQKDETVESSAAPEAVEAAAAPLKPSTRVSDVAAELSRVSLPAPERQTALA